MAILNNEILINAGPEAVWSVLSNLELLEQYDPITERSVAVTARKEGLGAGRKCDVLPKGSWFEEKVVDWRPQEGLAFELVACNLPVKWLRHTYTLHAAGEQTRVTQVMEYEMKFGLLGKAMNALFVRKKWNAGIRQFFIGLKAYVERPVVVSGS